MDPLGTLTDLIYFHLNFHLFTIYSSLYKFSTLFSGILMLSTFDSIRKKKQSQFNSYKDHERHLIFLTISIRNALLNLFSWKRSLIRITTLMWNVLMDVLFFYLLIQNSRIKLSIWINYLNCVFTTATIPLEIPILSEIHWRLLFIHFTFANHTIRF